ncbi:MAG: beta-propeller domain-containing protein [Oscillospiraceae bacterium]
MKENDISLEQEIEYFKQKFKAVDKDIDLPPSLYGANMLEKLNQSGSSTHKIEPDIKFYWKKAVMPLAACFVLVVGIYFAYDYIFASKNISSEMVQNSPTPRMAESGLGASYDTENEAMMAEYAVEDVAEQDTEADSPRAYSMTTGAQQTEKNDIASFKERNEIKQWIEGQAAVKSSGNDETSELPLTKNDTESMKENVAASVSEQSNLYCVVNSSETVELTVTDTKTKEQISSVELPDMTEGRSIHTFGNNLLIVGDGTVLNPVSTQTLMYNISNPQKPKRVGVYAQTGNYITSVKTDDVLYTVSQYHPQQSDGTFNLPQIKEFSSSSHLSLNAEKIFYSPSVPSTKLTLISAIKIEPNTMQTETKGFFFDSFKIYCDDEQVYTSEVYNEPTAETIYCEDMYIETN